MNDLMGFEPSSINHKKLVYKIQVTSDDIIPCPVHMKHTQTTTW